MNGKKLRNDYPLGLWVRFWPKSMTFGPPFLGYVKGHIYTNVLIVACNDHGYYREYMISANRCTRQPDQTQKNEFN